MPIFLDSSLSHSTGAMSRWQADQAESHTDDSLTSMWPIKSAGLLHLKLLALGETGVASVLEGSAGLDEVGVGLVKGLILPFSGRLNGSLMAHCPMISAMAPLQFSRHCPPPEPVHTNSKAHPSHSTSRRTIDLFCSSLLPMGISIESSLSLSLFTSLQSQGRSAQGIWSSFGLHRPRTRPRHC